MEIQIPTHFLFDVDGVFTDGSFYYSEDGKVLKKFGPHDGDGIKLLRTLGLAVSAISADHRGFEITRARMNDMKIDVELVSEVNRFNYVRNNFDTGALAFMGDGNFDAAVMSICGYSVAPANATRAAKRTAALVTSAKGGDGAVAEACFAVAKRFYPEEFDCYLLENNLNEKDF